LREKLNSEDCVDRPDWINGIDVTPLILRIVDSFLAYKFIMSRQRPTKMWLTTADIFQNDSRWVPDGFQMASVLLAHTYMERIAGKFRAVVKFLAKEAGCSHL
jgi:hypothetical protein